MNVNKICGKYVLMGLIHQHNYSSLETKLDKTLSIHYN